MYFPRSVFLTLVAVVAAIAFPQSGWSNPQDADSHLLKEFALLSKVFDQSGDKIIRSGEFTYEVLSQGDVPDAKAIAAVNQQAKQQLLAASEASDDPKVKAHLKSLAESDNDFGPSMIESANRRLQFFTAFSGPLAGGDFYVERRTWDSATSGFGNADCSLVRRYGDGRSDCIWLDHFLSGKVGSVEKIMAVQQAPHLLGRLSGSALTIGQVTMLEHTVNIKQTEGQQFGNEPAVQMSVFVRDFHTPGLGTINFTTVPGMNYIVPWIQELDEHGNILYQCKCEDYFEIESSGLLFPGRCTITSRATGDLRVERYSFDPRAVRVNVDVPKSRLRVRVPVGGELFVIDSSKALKAHESADLGIDDIPELAQNPAFHLFGEGRPSRYSTQTESWNSLYLLIATASLLIATLVFLKKWGKSGLLLLLICLETPFVLGCTAERNATSQAALAQVIDLGKVAIERKQIDFSIAVKNPSEGTRTLIVEPDCGCVILEEDRVTVQSGQTVTINGRLSLHGKSGDFESQIRISDTEEPLIDFGDPVLIKALVISSWTALPRRIVAHPGTTQNLRLVAPSNQWADVTVLSVGNGIRVNQVKSEHDEEGNIIKDFGISIGSLDQVYGSDAKVEVRDSFGGNSLLAIPVLVEGPDGLF